MTRDAELVDAVTRWWRAIRNLTDAAAHTFGAEVGSWWFYRGTLDTTATMIDDIYGEVRDLNSFKPIMQSIHGVLVENGPGRRWADGASPPEQLAPAFGEFKNVVRRVNILRNVHTHPKLTDNARDLADQGEAGRAQERYVGVPWIHPDDAALWNRLRFAIVEDCAGATKRGLHQISVSSTMIGQLEPSPAPNSARPAVAEPQRPRGRPTPRLVVHHRVVRAIAASDKLEFGPAQPSADQPAQRAVLSADGSVGGVVGSSVVLGSVVTAPDQVRWRPSARLSIDDASSCRLLAVARSGQTGVRAIITTQGRTELFDVAAEGRAATRRRLLERPARAAVIVAGQEWLIDVAGTLVGWPASPPLDEILDIDAARWGAHAFVAVAGKQADRPACATARYRLGTPASDIEWAVIHGVDQMAVARQTSFVEPPPDVFFTTE